MRIRKWLTSKPGLLLVALTSLMLARLADAADSGFTVESLASVSNAGYDFGQKIINWITYGSDTGSHGEKSLLSVLSLTLNTIGMFMMAALLVFGGGNYIIQTANKGVPGGQVISSFWMPLRMAVASILMVPLTSGFSGMQYGVTSVAEFGNTHANILEEKGLNYIYNYGVYRPIALINGEDIIFGWIGSEVCRQYINAYTNSETIGYVVSNTGNVQTGFINKIQYPYNESVSSFRASNPRSEYCGSITISSPAKGNVPDSTGVFEFAKKDDISTTVTSEAQSKLVILLNGLQPKISAIASKILADQSALQSMQSNGAGAQATFENALKEARGKASGLSGEIETVIQKYNEGRQSIVAQAVNSANSAAKDGKDWKAQTIDGGWPMLGTVFWQINTNQSQINSLAQLMQATATDPAIDGEWAQDQRLQEIAQRIQLVKKSYSNTGNGALTTDTGQIIPSLSAISMAGSEGSNLYDAVKMSMYNVLSSITKSALAMNSPDDLIINIQYIGSAIGAAAELMYLTKAGVFSGMTFVAKTAEATGEAISSNVFSWLTGVGVGAKTIGGIGSVTLAIIDALNKFLFPLIDQILAILIAVGFVAGVVLPTIPLSIWFMGVISWMLFYIECLLVSPFWLAAHGTAEKEGWGTEHTRQGYMLMIGLYLNPILRVAGFFAIFIALKPIGYLVAWFFDYVAGVLQSGFVNLFSSVGGVIVGVMFAYTAIVRVFSLPSELFEKGLRWVNGGHEVTGDGHSEEKARNNFMAFVSKGENAASRGMQFTPKKPVPGSDSPNKA